MAKQFKLKTDDKGVVLDEAGLPVYINLETNEEEPIDVNQLFTRVGELGKEAKKRRETNKTLMERLKLVEDIEDLPSFVEQARAAQDGKPKQNDEVATFRKQWADEKAQIEAKLREKDAVIQRNIVMTAFTSSKHFSGSAPKTLLPPAVAYKVFSDRFRVEEDEGEVRLVAINGKGEHIYSKKNPELLASFDEAVDMFLQEEPFKELVKFNGAPGSGSVGGGSSTTINSKQSQIAQATQEAQRTGDVYDLIKSKV